MPRVSIGLPVYNGEDFVAKQLESLLEQTFTDFELLIVDNASTDRTSEICRSVAARDRRVRYHRNEQNIGGGPNQNLAFDLSTPAPYFKWAAHDDIHAPRFLERCVEALDRDPTAVLAFPKAELIDHDGNVLGSRVLELPLSSPDVLVRFEAMLPSYDCLEIFGVIRRNALVGNPVMGLYKDADGVLLTRLALRGRFLEVPEVLFFNRRHASQATIRFEQDSRQWAAWWDPANESRRVFPAWRRSAELCKAVLKAPLSTTDRLRCAVRLARWLRWRRKRLYEDVEYHVKALWRSPGRAGGSTNGKDG
jgi:glycosyltransferase involved in cell wall biosynthesis